MKVSKENGGKMNNRREIVVGILVLFVVVVALSLILVPEVLAGSFGSSSYQYRPSYDTYYSSSQVRDYWPVLDNKEQCQARQDILLQVSPVGCQPAVVRSDLLAEQNVPVFCQIDALEINPLVNIEEIKNIRFTGKYPEGVVGAGFHPARAALKTRDKLLGDPLASNIGYVVVILKKTEREDDLPDFISLNLSGQIQYETGNAFGIGRSEFVLSPVVSDDAWESLSSGEKNSFWQGRYFLRLEEADSQRATVSVYQGDKKISTVRVEEGKTSRDIFVPGQYCQAGLQVQYDGYVPNENSVRIEIGENEGRDVVDLFERSKFLDGKCEVKEIKINGVAKDGTDSGKIGAKRTGNVIIKCNGVREDIKLELKERGTDEEGNVVEEITDTLSVNKEEYYAAIEAYKRVVEDYPQERENEVGKRFGEDALVRALELNKEGTDKTRNDLIRLFLETYPDSIEKINYEDALKVLQSIDSGNAAKGVEIDGRFRTLNLISLKLGKSGTSVDVSVGNALKPDLKQGALLIDGETDNGKKVGGVIISSIKADSIQFSGSCGNNVGRVLVTMKEGESKEICNQVVNVKRIDFEGIAKIRLNPKIKGTKTETNLTVNIGIEKRAIKLSPEKSLEKIENLNESIEKWEKISANLGKFNKGLKAACFATAGVLTIKNFISGIDGSSLGRQHAMQGTNGWTERCGNALKGNELKLSDGTNSGKTYSSVVECFNDNKDLIEKEVKDRAEIINGINERIPDVEGDVVIDNQKLTDEFYDNIKGNCGSGLENDFGKKEDWNAAGTTPWSLVDLREYCYAKEMESKGYKVFADSEIKRLTDKVRLQTGDLNAFLGSKASNGLLPGAADLKGGTKIVRARYYDTTSYNNILDPAAKSEIGGEGYDTAIIVVNAKKPVNKDTEIQGIIKKAIVFGKMEAGRFDPKKVYEYTEEVKGEGDEKKSVGSLATGENKEIDLGKFLDANSIASNGFEDLGDLSGNKILNPKVRFFGTGPDKGMPAIVPFEVNDGWYVRVQGNGDSINSVYRSSGLPIRWRICNVGSNNAINADDECGVTDGSLNSGETILGLSEARSKRLVQISSEAILDAARQRNLKIIKINGQNLAVGNIMSHNEGVQCHDFMSADDCKLLFNVCDPVICPSTRCDFGGEYPVADVIQTGIVGSIALCLPNAKEGILVPICTTGVQAGIDGYNNILKAHRDCLQENVETGRLTGICDEITSVYMCEFFWKQAAPLADIALPTVIDKIFNGGSRGGGEYNNVFSAWDNAKASTDFFTQNYAGNSFKAFQARSVAEAGTPVCRAFISAKAPSAFDVLTEPDSPSQFHAWFDSFTHSDATVPPTSQYKVFYTIYAGKDTGVHYSVYLKNPGDSVFFNIPESIQVDSGFIGRGEGKTETKDFTAPEGYKELCVRIGNEDRCGFKQVSTSFAVNKLRDEFVKGELGNTNINSEKACISGTTSLAALSNINLQSAAEEALNPEIEQRGIVRTCSTRNPGGSTDPTRYVEVGNCGNANDKCWLDKNSVENALTDANKGTQSVTLEELEKVQLDKLREEDRVVDETGLKGELDKINKLGTPKEKLKLIEEVFSNLVFNHHKAELLFEKAKILATEFMRVSGNVARESVDLGAKVDNSIGGDVVGDENSGESKEFVSQFESFNHPKRFKFIELSNGEVNEEGFDIETGMGTGIPTEEKIKDVKRIQCGGINTELYIGVPPSSEQVIRDDIFVYYDSNNNGLLNEKEIVGRIGRFNSGGTGRNFIIDQESKDDESHLKYLDRQNIYSVFFETLGCEGEVGKSTSFFEFTEFGSLLDKIDIYLNGKKQNLYFENKKIYLSEKEIGNVDKSGRLIFDKDEKENSEIVTYYSEILRDFVLS